MDAHQSTPGMPHPGDTSPGQGPLAAGPDDPGWSEGHDGTDPTYTERVWPGPLVWLVGAVAVLALALAYARALGPGAGVALAVGGLALGGALLAGTTPLLRVDSRVLRAGRARLPLVHAGRVLVLDRAGAGVARGAHGDPSAYLVTRAGVGGAVLVEVRDDQDPHRTWLIASRHPADLARAIEAGRGKVGP